MTLPNIWITSVFMGVQMMPDYNEQNENKGLKKTRAFGKLNFDSRWKFDSTSSEECQTSSDKTTVFNAGADILLLGTGDFKQTNSDTDTEDSDTETENSGNPTMPSKFSDISDTVDASIYFQWVPKHSFFNISDNSQMSYDRKWCLRENCKNK